MEHETAKTRRKPRADSLRNRERLLMNFWRMGHQAIERGNRDSWTITPKDVDAVKAAAGDKTHEADEYVRGAKAVDPGLYKTILNDPAKRDPRGYILAPDQQRDLPTTIAFLNALLKNGVDIERATAPFTAGGKSYPAGSYVVKTAQAYRPHVLDMFEPQDHPHDAEYPGGPPKAPYDITGYTLAWQMGVQFDRVRERFLGDPDITGAAIYAFAVESAEAAGWRFGGKIAGHIVAEFPHARLPGPKQVNHISPENPDRLRDPDANGEERFWILEIHLVEPDGAFGGFYERLMLD